MKILIDPQKSFFQEFISSHDLLLKVDVTIANSSPAQSILNYRLSLANCTLQTDFRNQEFKWHPLVLTDSLPGDTCVCVSWR